MNWFGVQFNVETRSQETTSLLQCMLIEHIKISSILSNIFSECGLWHSWIAIRDFSIRMWAWVCMRTRVHDTQTKWQDKKKSAQRYWAEMLWAAFFSAHNFDGIFWPMQRRNYYYTKMTSLYSSMGLSVWSGGTRIWADCHYVSQ